MADPRTKAASITKQWYGNLIIIMFICIEIFPTIKSAHKALY